MDNNIFNSRSYKKLTKDQQNNINKAISKLKDRYDNYIKQNIQPNKIFGDNRIIHKILNKEFYIYKCRINKVQIRLLYNTINNEINVISFDIKNNSKDISGSNQFQKQYFNKFKNDIVRYNEYI